MLKFFEVYGNGTGSTNSDVLYTNVQNSGPIDRSIHTCKMLNLPNKTVSKCSKWSLQSL